MSFNGTKNTINGFRLAVSKILLSSHVEIASSTICELCKVEVENLEHFILKCKSLDGNREKKFLEKFKDMNNEDILGNMLFNYEHIENTKKMLEGLWRDRERQIKSKAK